jgi:hypothetical protein
MKLRSHKTVIAPSVIVIPPVIVFEILSYIHPLLHCLIAGEYFHAITSLNNASNKLLPLSLLTLSLNNREFLDDFKAVLLSYKFRMNMATQLAMHGDYFSMLWFQDHDFTMPESAIVIVAKRGDLTLFERLISDFPRSLKKFFVENGLLMNKSLSAAAEYGHINILEYLMPNILHLGTNLEMATIFKRAARNGHLEFLKRFLQMILERIKQIQIQTYLTRTINEMVVSATKGDHMQILIWISDSLGWIPQAQVVWDREHHFGHDSMFVARAARNGNLEMVEFFIEKGFEFRHPIVTQQAAESGNLEVLMYLRSRQCPWSKNVFIAAAKEGHLDILKWAKSNECPWDSSILFPAAARCKGSNVDLFQWCLDQQCPFDEHSILAACNDGNFEFIKFAKSNGFSIKSIHSHILQEFAASKGNLEVILWAIKQAKPRVTRSLQILDFAAFAGQIHILEWLETVENPERLAGMIETLAGRILKQASIDGHVGVLKWAVNHGYKWDAKRDYDCYLQAIQYGQLETLIWMNGEAPIFTTDIAYPTICAAQNGHLEIVKWLHNHGSPCIEETLRAADNNKHTYVSNWIQQQLYGVSRKKKYHRLDMW